MEPQVPLSPEALLAHHDWIRALARTLVSDADRAEDVAQGTWLAAHTKPPRDARNLRAWLAEVARNLARSNARAEARRAQREHLTARPESLPDSADLVAQAELQRELVGHVLELDEPYRTVLLLRFFQDLEVPEIARFQNVPANTVRTRLQRALALLRARLDRKWGDRSSWCASLVALAPAARHAAWPAASSALMAAAWKIAAAVVLTAFGVWWYRSGSSGSAPSPMTLVERDEPRLTVPAQKRNGESLPSAQSSREPALAAASIPAPEKHTASGPSAIFEGRVVDVRGVAVPNLQLWAPSNGPPQAMATTDSTGSFRLEARRPTAGLRVFDDRWTLVSDGWREAPHEHIYIVAPSIDVAGIVTDAAGAPVPDVRVRRAVSRRGLREFPWTLDGGVDDYSQQSKTTADGRFRLDRIPVVLGERITAFRGVEGENGSILVPESSRSDLVIRLSPAPRDRRPRVRGLVLDAAGRAVPGAHVNFSNEESMSDETGRFELVVSNFDPDTDLTATMPGEIAAVIDGFGSELRKVEQETDEPSIDGVILQLGGPALTISGRLLDAADNPCAGWRVDLNDRTPLGNSTQSLEGVTAGYQSDHDFPMTDAKGKFTVGGLRNRSYQLKAWDERTCLIVVGEPTPAGSRNVELRVPRDAFRARIHGRVVSSRGEPVSGARVALLRVGDRMRATVNFAMCREVITNSSGEFEFVNIPRREMWLSVSGVYFDGRVMQPIASDANDEPVELVVMFLCRVHVVLDPADPADAFEVLDANAKRMRVQTQSPSAISMEDHVHRGADGFPLCKIADTARMLVLYRGETELRRVPIELHAGDLQTITP